ncbi:zinc-finger-containing protein [Cryobacterium sp. GrIS_2_6]|uniref:zinc-finger-containing protein n=1 Tax=Cryobacterium sp. GrIS_2_6 TaxID=3162785 RepID=UPI002E054F52|nr:hypothetical protein [Cryobacterium psychrotolerans]
MISTNYIVICPNDGKPAPWVENKEKYGRNYGKSYMCYYCKEHDTYVGCHNNTRQPLGSMADEPLRKARMAVHAKIDPLWRVQGHSRKDVYRFISKELGYQYHTGESDINTCNIILKMMFKLTNQQKGKQE